MTTTTVRHLASDSYDELDVRAVDVAAQRVGDGDGRRDDRRRGADGGGPPGGGTEQGDDAAA